jgi:IS5 family transposase
MIPAADAGYQGAGKRPDVAGDPHLPRVELRISARKSKPASMAQQDLEAGSRTASVRAKVEHPILIVKRDLGFTKTRYRRNGQ